MGRVSEEEEEEGMGDQADQAGEGEEVDGLLRSNEQELLGGEEEPPLEQPQLCLLQYPPVLDVQTRPPIRSDGELPQARPIGPIEAKDRIRVRSVRSFSLDHLRGLELALGQGGKDWLWRCRVLRALLLQALLLWASPPFPCPPSPWVAA